MRGVAELYAATEYITPEEFCNARVKDADALIIRTRTRAGRELLEGTRVRMVATATIGYDHIDTAWCGRNGVHWAACPGCNAQGVCDYVEEALKEAENGKPEAGCGKTIGIVGVGHVGGKVAQMAERRGYRVLLNDPPKGIGVTLDEIAEESDIITFHTPLTMEGEYRTYHLCDRTFLAKCKDDAMIINAARGGVVDEEALLQSGHKCVIDCWENEPHINVRLLESCNTVGASYHIAGYTAEGKLNATKMCIEALRTFFSLRALPDEEKALTLQPEQRGDSSAGWLKRLTEQLKAAPENFELLRKQYKLR